MGVVHTDEGWFPATNVRVLTSSLWFDFYIYYGVAPSSVDRRIIDRAATLLSTDDVWNRKDDRNCPKSPQP